jgi:hypothetical protein
VTATPGQADMAALVRAAQAADHATRPAGRNWTRVGDDQVARLIGGAQAALIAAQEPHAAPGPAGCECGHAQTGHAFSDDVCAVPDCPCPGYRRTPRAAPELAAAMRESRLRAEVITEILAAFSPSGSGHTARVGQVQIAKWRTRAGLTS